MNLKIHLETTRVRGLPNREPEEAFLSVPGNKVIPPDLSIKAKLRSKLTFQGKYKIKATAEVSIPNSQNAREIIR